MIDEELPKRAQEAKCRAQTVAPRTPTGRFRPSEACFLRRTVA
jgi:hypothetical protein